MQKLYMVTGISGSGKTTIARRLLRHGEVAFDSKLNPGLYHFVDQKGKVAESVHLQDKAWREQFKWCLNEAELDKLLQQHANVGRVFLCGRANLFQYWQRAAKVFLLKIDKPTLRKRLNSLTRDKLFAKDAETQERLVAELDAVQNKITQKGAIVIDAKSSAEAIVDRMVREIN